MSETYLITAKTVEEAIAIANREYADQDHEVSYEILEMPKKGFLGIGAKDAKIKITVTKSVSADLASLVSDIRGMKVMTSRGGDGKKQNNNNKNQNQQKQKRDGEQKADGQQKHDGQKPQQNQQRGDNPAQRREKPQNPQTDKADGQQKRDVQKQQAQQNPQKREKPLQENKPAGKGDAAPAEKKNQNQNQQRGDKPAEKRDKPRERVPQENKPELKADAQKTREKPQQVQEKPVKAEAPAEEKSELSSKLDAAISSATTVDVTPKFGDVKAEYKSNLRNQAKPNRRAPQKASTSGGEQLGGGVTVSAPVGLTDFSAGEGSGFGYGDEKPGGRISNDIKRGKRNNRGNTPKAENKPAAPAVSASIEEAKAEIPAPVSENGDMARDESYEKKQNNNNRRKRDRKRNDRRPEGGENAPKLERRADAEPVEQKQREPITQAEMDYALDFLNTLLKNMALGAVGVPAQCPEGEEFVPTEEASVYPKINIEGDDTGILIGHHGETLDAIQYLVNLSALRKSKSKDGDYIKIVVDIENYREKREETLRQLARRMAQRAVKYRRNVFLEPMNAYERRIIHSELQNYENVSTHSVGADRDRKIIVTYEGPDKAPEKPRRRRGDRKTVDVEQTAEVAEITYADMESYSAEEDNASEVIEALQQAAVFVKDENENTAGAGDAESRRSRKVQKMPIEKFTELLAADNGEPDEKPAFED